LNLLCADLDAQFRARLEVFEEEAKNNQALVNPFDLNTDNMTRIEGFNLLMARRVFFGVNPTSDSNDSFKSKLLYNDYLLFFETEEECVRRMSDSLGFQI
jgi:hypothetical protein